MSTSLPDVKRLSAPEKIYHWINVIGIPALMLLGGVTGGTADDSWAWLLFGWIALSGLIDNRIRRLVTRGFAGIGAAGCLLAFVGSIALVGVLLIATVLFFTVFWMILAGYLVLSSAYALIQDSRKVL